MSMRDTNSSKTQSGWFFFKCFLHHFSLLLILLILVEFSYAKRPQSQWQPPPPPPPSTTTTSSAVNSLPGFFGDLPFYLETGYVGVGNLEEVQLFYSFIESEGDPKRDPLFLWLSGGPGCSAFTGLFLEIGPLFLNQSALSWRSEVPILELNPYSWTKVASIIFLDSPVGTGFSYATISEGYYTDATTSARHVYEFLRKWLMAHDKFQNNPFYIAGDSYSGIGVPIVVQEIIEGNKVRFGQPMNLKGYILGNPMTDKEQVKSSKIEYGHRMSLLSDELYESTRMDCAYANSTDCQRNLNAVSYNLDSLFEPHILEPACDPSSTQIWCRDNSYELLILWANNKRAQEALHIREGTKSSWTRCNRTVAYTENVKSSFDYHQNLTRESISALIYSGDQDIMVPYVDTLTWIKKLNVSVIDKWRPWFIKHQVSGYSTKYWNGHYNLTFSTIKGAGHMAPEYNPYECFHMIVRWLTMSHL